MANFSAAARTRALLAGKPAPAPSSHYQFPFTDDTWRLESRLREAVDCLVYPLRWRVVIVPQDRQPRTFYLRGTHAGVTLRAHHIFTSPHVVLIEPAPVQHGPEVFDRRLSVTTGET